MTDEPVATAAAFAPGDRVYSAHNPRSRGTVVAVHRVDGTVSVEWDGYGMSERWSPKVLREVTDGT